MLIFHAWTGDGSPLVCGVPFDMDCWWSFLVPPCSTISFYNFAMYLSIMRCAFWSKFPAPGTSIYVRKGLVKQLQMIISGKSNEIPYHFFSTWPFEDLTCYIWNEHSSTSESPYHCVLCCIRDVLYILFSSTSGHPRLKGQIRCCTSVR